jgi:hypothetical protein
VASAVDIGNSALQMLGAGQITSFNDNSNNARAISLAYPICLNAELRRHRWRFAIVRANLAALSSAPVNGVFGLQYQLPADCVRILNVGDWDPGQDTSDYRFRDVSEYSLEGRVILTNYSSPLSLRYVSNTVAVGSFDSAFVDALAARIAWRCCETITQSENKRTLAINEYKQAIREAILANALESPPQFRSDDSWVTARIQ